MVKHKPRLCREARSVANDLQRQAAEETNDEEKATQFSLHAKAGELGCDSPAMVWEEGKEPRKWDGSLQGGEH